MPGKLSVLETLQAAAIECQKDEKEDIEDAMYFAADQIANERGLTSPQRKQKFNPADAFVDVGDDRLSLNTSGVNRGGSSSPRPDTARSQQLEANLDALFKDMNFVPKQNLENNLIDDVDKLLELQAVKEGKVEKAEIKKKEVDKDSKLLNTTSKAKDRYLQRLLSSKNKTIGPGHHLNKSHGSGMFIETQPAKVAVLLEKADEKEWSEHIRQSFHTTAEELLFRSMKKVQPVSAKSRTPGRPSQYTNGSQYSKERREIRSRSSLDASDSISLSSMDSQRLREAYETMRRSTQRLSAPNSYGPSKLDVKIDPTLKYSTYEEARECTFRPTIGKKKKASNNRRRDNDSDEEKKEDERYGFLNRQDDQERSRRQQLADDMGQADYDALLTKKTCPSCGAKQSYDEYKEKRKMCPNCRVEYKPALSWNTVSKKFFQRDKEYHKKLDEKHRKIESEIADSMNFIERKVVDKETGKVITIKEPKNKIITPQEEEEFYSRLHDAKIKREENLEKITKKVYEEFTFKPKMNKKHGSDDEADSDEDGNAVFEKFIKRVDEDMEYRREIMPTKYLPIRKHNPDDDLEPFRI